MSFLDMNLSSKVLLHTGLATHTSTTIGSYMAHARNTHCNRNSKKWKKTQQQQQLQKCFDWMLRMSLWKSLVSNCLSNNNNQFLRMNARNSVERVSIFTQIIIISMNVNLLKNWMIQGPKITTFKRSIKTKPHQNNFIFFSYI